jgi:hypothetical protein
LLASLRSTLTRAPSAGKRSLGFHAKKFVARKRGNPVHATHQAAATAQQREPSFYNPRRDFGLPLDSWARSSTNPSTTGDFAARCRPPLGRDRLRCSGWRRGERCVAPFGVVTDIALSLCFSRNGRVKKIVPIVSVQNRYNFTDRDSQDVVVKRCLSWLVSARACRNSTYRPRTSSFRLPAF